MKVDREPYEVLIRFDRERGVMAAQVTTALVTREDDGTFIAAVPDPRGAQPAGDDPANLQGFPLSQALNAELAEAFARTAPRLAIVDRMVADLETAQATIGKQNEAIDQLTAAHAVLEQTLATNEGERLRLAEVARGAMAELGPLKAQIDADAPSRQALVAERDAAIAARDEAAAAAQTRMDEAVDTVRSEARAEIARITAMHVETLERVRTEALEQARAEIGGMVETITKQAVASIGAGAKAISAAQADVASPAGA